jgi:uncharacterized protein
MRRILSWLLIQPVRIYQYLLSPLLPPMCRYEPSCSNYFIQSIHLHGPLLGTYRGCKRLCRCHPFSKGGFDPP